MRTIQDIIDYYSKQKEDKPMPRVPEQYENHELEWREEENKRRFMIKNPNYREDQMQEEADHINEGDDEE